MRVSIWLASRRGAATLVLASVLLTGASAGASSVPTARHPGLAVATPGSDYLALGDSVSFGYRESTTTPAPDYGSAANFVGFPEYVASALGLHLANAACPGETSSSFLDPSALSNGCENHPSATGTIEPGGYRTIYPLHVRYPGSQMAFALHYLRTHPRTSLVTLMIGANDGFICQQTTADQCVSATELAPVLATVTAHVHTIVRALRLTAHFTGQIVLVNYYATNYANPLDSAASAYLNKALDAGGAGFHVEVADGYGAFEQAAQYSAGDSCAAGLLTRLFTASTFTGCGVHPSVAGQALLAQTVESVVKK
ncbi:MAG TPA: SGNH/GDSL hydrolase family protein [Acidimicrobiales bacterium]|nr:SGNH/GDSL hydrolase family protein [Acidimicrobiales bacterium]